MMARALLVVLAFSLIGLAVAAPAAAAAPPCVVGGPNDDPTTCAVTFWTVVCVTEPCDTIELCVAYGRLCI